MRFLSFLMGGTPRDSADEFSRLYKLQVPPAREASGYLTLYFKYRNPEDLRKIEELEHSGDDAHDAVVAYADRKHWLAPYDGPEVSSLIEHLDGITDDICKAAQRLCDYNIEVVDPVSIQLCELSEASVAVLADVINSLPRFDKDNIAAAYKEIQNIERSADQLRRKSRREVYRSISDDGTLTKRQMACIEINSYLERITDKCLYVIKSINTASRKENG